MAENFWDIDIVGLDFDFGDDDKNIIVSTKQVPAKMIKYENAVKLAKKIDLSAKSRYECIIKGNFIFGDFIEAFFVENDIYTDELTISTLSFGVENVDSLLNLIGGGYVGRLRILSSVYFYANERKKGGIVDYLFNAMPKDRLQCAFADVHTKMVTFKTEDEKHIVMTGSANLRSSGCIEQFAIEDNKETFEFFDSYHNEFFKMYDDGDKKPLRKNILNKELKAVEFN